MANRHPLAWQRYRNRFIQSHYYPDVRTLVDYIYVGNLYCLLENSTMIRLVQNLASSLNSLKYGFDSLPKY